MPSYALEAPQRRIPAQASPTDSTVSKDFPPPPTSAVNVYQLGFGTVCGVCAGVFIKKGARALAFLLGGVFVFLQVRIYITMIAFFLSKVERTKLSGTVFAHHLFDPYRLGRGEIPFRKRVLYNRYKRK
jgi:hypothetical protein